MIPDQTAPKGDSLILVHIVCNIGYLRTCADERGRNKSCDWREKGEHLFKKNDDFKDVESVIHLTLVQYCVTIRVNF